MKANARAAHRLLARVLAKARAEAMVKLCIWNNVAAVAIAGDSAPRIFPLQL